MPAVTERIRRHYLLLYGLVVFITAVASAFLIQADFDAYVARQKAELVREANITNALIENDLVDVTKLLDVTLPIVTQAMDEGRLTPGLAHEILASQRKTFSAFAVDQAFLLTLYIDENGLLQATDAGIPDTQIDLADRLYFLTLKNNPGRPFAIGNLVTARTTGLLTFHIARPLIDHEGKFRGALVQQVLANQVAADLALSIDAFSDAQIVVHIGGGNVAFMYPAPSAQGADDVDKSLYLHEFIVADGRRSAAIAVPASKALARDSYVGYAISRIHALETSVAMSKHAVFAGFTRAYRSMLITMGLAFAGISFVIWRFYLGTLAMLEAQTVSFTDPLTGIKNRRAFDSEFPALWKASLRAATPLSVLFIDIDHFKIFNDTYGHDHGDEALVAVAHAIVTCATRPLDLCCRWGGEEFAVVLPETDEQGAVHLADKILAAVRAIRLDFGEGKEPAIAVSIGIAGIVPTKKNQAQDLMEMADMAMYDAKQSGRDRYAIYRKHDG